MPSVAADFEIAGAGGAMTLVERAGTPPATPPWIVGPIRNWLAGQGPVIRNWIAQVIAQLNAPPPPPGSTGPTGPTINDFDTFFATLIANYDAFSTSQGAPTIELVSVGTADAMNLHANGAAGRDTADMFLFCTLANAATGRLYDARLQMILDRPTMDRLNNFFWLLQTLSSAP